MLKLPLPLLLISCLSLPILPACSPDSTESQQQPTSQQQTQKQTTVTTAQLVSEGLDLSRITEMVKEAKDAEELENYLNTSGLNNLDLNTDGKVDYLNVEEFQQDGQRGFLLYTYENEQQTDIARITISQQNETTDVSVEGNPQYYGPQAHYHSSFPLGQVLLTAWLFNSLTRPPYAHAPYHAGRYPAGHSGQSAVSPSAYRNRLNTGGLQANGKTFNTPAQRSLRNTPGQSFQTTTDKRPAATTPAAKTDNRPAGSATRSSTSRGAFGSGSNRQSTSNRRPSSGSFGSSSRRSGGRRR